ncbi:protein UNUSUAL FLORAL ORGANS [Amaranthus tricolor]|uniref:protein UNUSUAL FLORAL ORGANS n=1 Tax=Amaranthus tricolor TaxID=29722 RepID=UPI0025885820|nr:protein UNUSUAL FLORAL ORGANS [Amaranthus tricolor]
MEAFNTSSITLPFPYTYGITNVTNFTPLFPPHSTYNNIFTPTLPFPQPNMPPNYNTTLSCNMDTHIWTRIPQQLLDRILAFLPLPAFFRARSVCKRWYSLLYSKSFLQLYLKVSPNHHWFIFFIHKTPTKNIIYTNTNDPNNNMVNTPSSSSNTKAYLFDPYELKWYTIPFPLIPLGFSPATSSGGLICWISDGPGLKNLFLHNPLLGSTTQLPQTRRPRLFPSMGLSITTSSINLILAGDDLISPYAVKNLTSETFLTNLGGFYTIWDTISTLPKLSSFGSGQMIHSNGRFYCMNYSPFSVLTYDICSNYWWKIQAPMKRFLRSPCLIESKKKVILIAAVEKSKLNVPRSLRMWVLQMCGTQWVEIERMPQELYAQFEEVEGERGFDCIGSGEFIVIMIKGINKGLLFDFDKKIWVWMPLICCDNNGGNDLHGFGYEPKLVTPVIDLVHQLLGHQF